MNLLKRCLGIFWLLLGPLSMGYLIFEAWQKIAAHPVQDVYLPWIIIIIVFLPVAIGLMVFGYYALKGEYDV